MEKDPILPPLNSKKMEDNEIESNHTIDSCDHNEENNGIECTERSSREPSYQRDPIFDELDDMDDVEDDNKLDSILKKWNNEVNNPKVNSRCLIWPDVCWICKESANITQSYFICSGNCKRVYHSRCHAIARRGFSCVQASTGKSGQGLKNCSLDSQNIFDYSVQHTEAPQVKPIDNPFRSKEIGGTNVLNELLGFNHDLQPRTSSEDQGKTMLNPPLLDEKRIKIDTSSLTNIKGMNVGQVQSRANVQNFKNPLCESSGSIKNLESKIPVENKANLLHNLGNLPGGKAQSENKDGKQNLHLTNPLSTTLTSKTPNHRISPIPTHNISQMGSHSNTAGFLPTFGSSRSSNPGTTSPVRSISTTSANRTFSADLIKSFTDCADKLCPKTEYDDLDTLNDSAKKKHFHNTYGHQLCFFCSVGYAGCNSCRNFRPQADMCRCLVKECTTYYCYPQCLADKRIIIPDKNLILAHKLRHGHARGLMDVNGRLCFVCHSHTCWSCYDSDRYSYHWEMLWRNRLLTLDSGPLLNYWAHLKRTCMGKIESSYFKRGKKILKPKKYPEMKIYRTYLQRRPSNSLTPAFNSLGSGRPKSDTIDRSMVHLLLKCNICDRTWCCKCIHPDTHVIPNSNKQIICHDCIHLQIAREVTKADRRGRRGGLGPVNENVEPIEISSRNPSEIYTEITNYIREHASYEAKLMVEPTFVTEALDDNGEGSQNEAHFGWDMAGIGQVKSLRRKPQPPIKSSDSKTIRTVGDYKLVNKWPGISCKEWDFILKRSDSSIPFSKVTNFKYITSNIWSVDGRKMIIINGEGERCSCTIHCDSSCSNVVQNVECNQRNCGLQTNECGNRHFANFKDPKIMLRYSREKGVCALASEVIANGELVCECVGEVVSSKEFDENMKSWSFAEFDNSNQCHWYMMKNLYLDATYYSNVSRFLNHSCEPNCEIVPIRVLGIYRMGIFARRRIAMYEELTYNYAFNLRGIGKGFECLCGSRRCKGVVGTQSIYDFESIMKIEDMKSKGAEADVLQQLVSDIGAVSLNCEHGGIKRVPNAIDVLNGIMTAGDLNRYERVMMSEKGKLNWKDSMVNVVFSLLAQNSYLPVAQLNYAKFMALNGGSLKEFVERNTKMFASNIPWAIVALAQTSGSLQRSMEFGCGFEAFYNMAKRYIQRMMIVRCGTILDEKAAANLQRLASKTWEVTEPWVFSKQDGKSQCCSSCGEILSDEEKCGDFYQDSNEPHLCTICKNSDHRHVWLMSMEVEKERLAMELWTTRMKQRQNRYCNIFAECIKRGAVLDQNKSAQHRIRSDKLFVKHEELDVLESDPEKLYQQECLYYKVCQNAVENFTTCL